MNMFRFNLWPRPFLHPSATQGMEGTPFFPNPLAIPSTLAFANAVESTKNGLHDKDKDGMIPYTNSLPLFRPGDAIPPAALYSPLHQQFLRAHMELANAQNREDANVRMTHTSAFLPTKRLRSDDTVNERVSPIVPRESPPADISRRHVNEDNALSSPGSHVSRISSPRDLDESDDRRSNSASEPLSTHSDDALHCPICRCALASEDMASHIAKEIHELRIMGNDRHSLARAHLQFSTNDAMPSRSRYETFMRIRGNRENRLAKLRGIRRKRAFEDDSILVNGHDDSFNSKKDDDEPIDIMSCDDAERETFSQGESVAMQAEISRKYNRDCNHSSNDVLCCSGCMTSFTKVVPVTSTKCWHVRCESCWQQSLDQCPQCNGMISPEDLKRIFM